MIGREFEIDQLVQQCDLARTNQQLEHQHGRCDARCEPLVARALEQICHRLVELHALVVLLRGQIVLELQGWCEYASDLLLHTTYHAVEQRVVEVR